MKLSSRDAHRFFASPGDGWSAVLIHGADPMRVALKRQDLVKALLGRDGEAEMRLTRLQAGDIRKDPAALADAIKAQGFFSGPRTVLLEDAADGLAKTVAAALEDWQAGDAQLVVTAGQLNARSALRKLFEGGRTTYAAAIYADPPGRDEIEAALAQAGLTDIPGPAMRDLTELAQALDPGDFRQTLEKIALYKHGDTTPLSSEDIDACRPATEDTDIDAVIDAAADGDVSGLGDMLSRLAAQGANPTQVCIFAGRHFRQLHAAATHPGGPEAGLSQMRPPVFGPRRDRMTRQARKLGPAKLESILALILDTDLALRSTSAAPATALVERGLIRIAMTAAR